MTIPAWAQLGPAAAKVAGVLGPIVAQAAANQAMDAMLQPGPVWTGDTPPSPAMSPGELAGNISIVINNQDDYQGTANAGHALGILGQMEGGVTAMEARAPQLHLPPPPELEAYLSNITDGDEETLRANGVPEALEKDNFEEENQKKLKSLRRARKMDARFVSMEPHEWRYCRDSGAIAQVYELALDGPQTPTLTNSYPAWVHSTKMRKIVQRLRTINRLARSKNAKKILELLGKSKADIVAALVEGGDGGQGFAWDCQVAVNEFNECL